MMELQKGQIVRIRKSRYSPYQFNRITYSLIVDNEGEQVTSSRLQEGEFLLEWLEDYSDLPLLGDIIHRELVGETFELKITDFEESRIGFLYEIREEQKCVPIHSINRRVLCQIINTRNEPQISLRVGDIKRFAHLRFIEPNELRVWLAFDTPEKHHVTKLLEFINQNRNQLMRAKDPDLICESKVALLALIKKALYRVRIIKDVGGGQNFLVQLIDWGGRQTVERSFLFRSSYPLSFYPPQARPAIMGTTSIGSIHPNYFEYINERKAFSIQTISNLNPMKGEIKVRIHDDFKKQDIVTDFQRLLILPAVSRKNKLLTHGAIVKVNIHKIYRGKFLFTVIKNGDGKFLSKLEDDVRKFANSPETFGSFPSRGLEGQKYFAIGHDDFRCQRGYILSPEISHDEMTNQPFFTVKFKVLYIDYGDTDIVLGKQLKPLSYEVCSEDALGAVGICPEICGEKYNSVKFQMKFFNKETLLQITSKPYYDSIGRYHYKVRFISE